MVISRNHRLMKLGKTEILKVQGTGSSFDLSKRTRWAREFFLPGPTAAGSSPPPDRAPEPRRKRPANRLRALAISQRRSHLPQVPKRVAACTPRRIWQSLVNARPVRAKRWFFYSRSIRARVISNHHHSPNRIAAQKTKAQWSKPGDHSLLLILYESWVEEVAAIFVRGSVSRQENCNRTHHK